MPPRRKPAPLPPAEMRARILDAALHTFAEFGYDGATVREIGAEAGVAPGLLYHYFESKEEILRALFDRSSGLVLQAFTEAAQVPDPADRLAALLRVSARIVREHEDFWRVSYSVRAQLTVVAGLAPEIHEQTQAWLTLFQVLLTELGRPDPAIEAQILFATLDGVFQHYVLQRGKYPLDAVIERVITDHGGRGATP